MSSVPSSFAIHTSSVTSLPPPARCRAARALPSRAAVPGFAGGSPGTCLRCGALAIPAGTRGSGHRGRLAGRGRAGAGQEGQHLTDGAFLAGGFWQREVRLDVVAVAAAVFLLDHVAGLDQVRDDAEGAAFGDPQAGRDVAQAYPGVMGD